MKAKKVGLLWSKSFFEEREELCYQLKPNFKGKSFALVQEALSEVPCEVVLLDVDSPLEEVVKRLKKEKIGFAFNLSVSVAGMYGQSVLPAILDSLHIPYLGSDAIVQSLSLDRALLKLALRGVGVPTPWYFLWSKGDAIPDNLDFPVLVKSRFRTPTDQVTIECVSWAKEELEEKLKTFSEAKRGKLLVEKLVIGREMVVGIWGNGEDIQLLPLLEVNLGRKNLIFTSEEKWRKGYVEDALCPAGLDEETVVLIGKMALKIYQELDIRDFAAFHFIFSEKEGIPLFFEINALPSLYLKHSAFPQMCEVAGFDYKKMIQKLFLIAQERLRR
ncbi:MAG: hypothetical protein ABDK94_08525 [Atribacterota bacterium]